MPILDAVRSSKEPRLARDLWYGRPKVGKSTLASRMPAPIFISLDEGVSHLDMPLYPQVRTYEELIGAITVLRSEPHKYRTLVVDGIDVAERMIAEHVARTFKDNKGKSYKTIAEIPYKDGYSVAIDQCWRPLLGELRILQHAKKMHIVLTGWAVLGKGSDADGDKGRKWQPMLVNMNNANTPEQVMGWAENVLFLTIDESALDGKMSVVTDEAGQAKRIIKTGPDGGWVAGNRWGMPPEIPCTIEAYRQYAQETK